MPVQECKSDGQPGYRWGQQGKCYTYSPGDKSGANQAKLKAFKQGMASGETNAGGTMSDAFDHPIVGEFALADLPAEDSSLTWIQVMVVGKFNHSQYGKFSITRKDLDGFAADIKARADRIQIDFDHESSLGKTRAAGWYTGKTEIKSDSQGRESLFAEVEFTPSGAAAVRSKEYRYISPEMGKQWRDAFGKIQKGYRMFATALTNRAFLPEMEPVTLSDVSVPDLVASDQLDAVAEKYGSEVSELVLAGLAVEDERVKETISAVLAQVAPPEEKPPITTKGAEVDLSELAVSIGLAEDADEETVKAKLKELNEEGGTVAEEKKAPDYLRMLGLDETADPNKKIAAALNQKDEEILGLTTKVTELTAKLKETDKLNERVDELEARDRQRDNEVYLARAVEKGQVLPAEKEKLAELFADNVSGLRALIATRPAGFSAMPLKPKGIVGDPDRFADDSEVAAYVKANTYEEPVDTESAKIHLQAMQILKEKGKDDDYTPDDYIKACEEAEKQLVY